MFNELLGLQRKIIHIRPMQYYQHTLATFIDYKNLFITLKNLIEYKHVSKLHDSECINICGNSDQFPNTRE